MNNDQKLGNILIVDDIPDNLRLLTQVLTEHGYQVRAAKTGKEALVSVRNASPDLVLLDVKLPDMNGYEVCRRLKSDGSTKEIPVIFLSILDETEDKIKGFQAGGVDYITKPFQPGEVLSRILTHLNISRLHAKLEQQAETLRISEERYKKAQEVGHVGSWEYDIKNNAFWGSDEGKRIYGFNHETDVFTADEVMKCVIDRNRVDQAMVDLIEKNEPYNIVFDIIPLNTSEKKTISSIAELVRDGKGNPVKVTGVLQDITERKLAEEEIKYKNEELVKLIAEKDKFFSIIAHDLRAPFSSFLGFTQVMAEELPSLTLDQIQKMAVNLRRSASSLYNLLDNLLEWSRMQRGLIAYEPSKLLLLSKISESLPLALESAHQKEITISWEIPESYEIYADGNMLGAILRNLVSNAVKFTAKGGKINISAKLQTDNSVEISIKDTGIGMNKVMIAGLFHLDGNTNRKGTEGEPSTGLGLVICKEFVEKHGGKLWVESEEGIGSSFCFTLPVFKSTQ